MAQREFFQVFGEFVVELNHRGYGPTEQKQLLQRTEDALRDLLEDFENELKGIPPRRKSNRFSSGGANENPHSTPSRGMNGSTMGYAASPSQQQTTNFHQTTPIHSQRSQQSPQTYRTDNFSVTSPMKQAGGGADHQPQTHVAFSNVGSDYEQDLPLPQNNGMDMVAGHDPRLELKKMARVRGQLRAENGGGYAANNDLNQTGPLADTADRIFNSARRPSTNPPPVRPQVNQNENTFANLFTEDSPYNPAYEGNKMTAGQQRQARGQGSRQGGQPKDGILEIELAIAEKLYQSGVTRQVFSKWDTAEEGKLSPEAFSAAVSSLGILLSPAESNMLLQKYDIDGDGHIWYSEMIQFLQSRSSVAHTSTQAAFPAFLTGRAVPSHADVHYHQDTRQINKDVRIRRGIEAVRAKLESRFGNLRRVFMELDVNSDGTISVDELMAGIVRLGFPHDLCNQSEVYEYAQKFAEPPSESDPHVGMHINYSGFVRMFLHGAGDETSLEVGELESDSNSGLGLMMPSEAGQLLYSRKGGHGSSAAPIHTQKEFYEFMTAMKSIPIRDLYFELDAGRTGLVSIRDMLLNFRSRGLSARVSENQELFDYISTYSHKHPDCLTYLEFQDFMRNGAKPPSPTARKPARRPLHKVVIGEDVGGEEALMMMKDKCVGLGAILRKLFAQYDLDGDGTTSFDDIIEVLERVQVHIESNAAKRVTTLFHSQANGRIRYNDLVETITNRDDGLRIINKKIASYPLPQDHNVLDPQTLPPTRHAWRPVRPHTAPSTSTTGVFTDVPPEVSTRRHMQQKSHFQVGSAGLSLDDEALDEDVDPYSPRGAKKRFIASPNHISRITDGTSGECGIHGSEDEYDRRLSKKVYAQHNMTSLSAAGAGIGVKDLPQNIGIYVGADRNRNSSEYVVGSPKPYVERSNRPYTPRHRQYTPEPRPSPLVPDVSARHLVNNAPSNTDSGVDPAIIQRISETVYGNGRLMKTFRDIAVTDRKNMSKREFMDGLRKLGLNVPIPQIHALFDLHDRDGSGKLTYSDFVRLLRTP